MAGGQEVRRGQSEREENSVCSGSHSYAATSCTNCSKAEGKWEQQQKQSRGQRQRRIRKLQRAFERLNTIIKRESGCDGSGGVGNARTEL